MAIQNKGNEQTTIIMKIITWLISSLNIYLGIRAFLNVTGILQTSKYSPTVTLVFAILFLGLGACGFYFSLVKANDKVALIVSIGPWLLALVFLFITMITSDYK